jgi:transposase InsO family protein
MTAITSSIQDESRCPSRSTQDAGQEGRKELAQLIGRLLAHHWLAKKRAGRGTRAVDTSESSAPEDPV